MRRIAAHPILLCSLMVSCGSGSSSSDEPQPCERLREHVLEVSLQDVALDVRKQHREALQQALGNFVETCTAQLSEEQLGCALEASTSETLRACTSR